MLPSSYKWLGGFFFLVKLCSPYLPDPQVVIRFHELPLDYWEVLCKHIFWQSSKEPCTLEQLLGGYVHTHNCIRQQFSSSFLVRMGLMLYMAIHVHVCSIHPTEL